MGTATGGSRVAGLVVGWVGVAALMVMGAGEARGGAEVSLDRDFINGLVRKLPPKPFKKDGQYHGSARGFHLVAIDPVGRRLVVGCEVAGEFRPPGAPPGRVPLTAAEDATNTPGWRSFTFDVRASVKVELGADGTPRFAVDVEEVKRRELEGGAGLFAKVLGSLFDDAVTKVADGKAATMGEKLNAKMAKQVEAFRQYGVFCGIDYATEGVTLRFDVTRLKLEGVAGYVFAEAAPGTVPLYRFVRPRPGDHFYAIDPQPTGMPGYVRDGVACYVYDRPAEGTVPFEQWRKPRECFYTIPLADNLPLTRLGYRAEMVACHLYREAKAGTVPLYRFVDPVNGLHSYSTHPNAEFVK